MDERTVTKTGRWTGLSSNLLWSNVRVDRLLYVSMTGAAHNAKAQAIHANNLANVTTTGFKGDFEASRAMPVFGDVYASRVYALTERPATDMAEGPLMDTGRDLDVAFSRDGCLAVRGPDGEEAYTRAGELTIDAAGGLRTGTGHPVLGDSGPITVPEHEKLEVGLDGTITIRALGQTPDTLLQVSRLRLVSDADDRLEKGADGLFRLPEGGRLPEDPTVQVSSGVLERSNVNAVSEMVEIMALSRQFELQVKMMRKADELAESSSRLLRIG